MVNRMETSDIINYRDNTHIITDYCYDSFGRRIHTVERTKTGMRTIYDGLSFEVVKEREDPHTHELKKRSSEAPKALTEPLYKDKDAHKTTEQEITLWEKTYGND